MSPLFDEISNKEGISLSLLFLIFSVTLSLQDHYGFDVKSHMRTGSGLSPDQQRNILEQLLQVVQTSNNLKEGDSKTLDTLKQNVQTILKALPMLVTLPYESQVKALRDSIGKDKPSYFYKGSTRSITHNSRFQFLFKVHLKDGSKLYFSSSFTFLRPFVRFTPNHLPSFFPCLRTFANFSCFTCRSTDNSFPILFSISSYFTCHPNSLLIFSYLCSSFNFSFRFTQSSGNINSCRERLQHFRNSQGTNSNQSSNSTCWRSLSIPSSQTFSQSISMVWKSTVGTLCQKYNQNLYQDPRQRVIHDDSLTLDFISWAFRHPV